MFEVVAHRNDDVDVRGRGVVVKDRVQQSLLNEGSSESLFADTDVTPSQPSMRHTSRRAEQAQETPRRAATQEFAIEELGVGVEHHSGAGGDRGLRGQWRRWRELAHRASFAQWIDASSRRRQNGVSKEEW